MRLTINLATRGRPKVLLKTIERTQANICRPDTTFMVSIDIDDYETRDALADYKRVKDLRVHAGWREDSLGRKYNRCLRVAPADVYLVMVDYRPFVTPGFDEKILEAASIFPDGMGVVYNEMANWSFPQMNAMTAKLAQKLGGIYPEYFPVWFIDHWLDDLAKMIGRIVYCDVRQEELTRPSGTQNLRDCNFWAGFYTKMAPEREAIAAGIIGSGEFLIPEWQKRQLMANFPLINQRSEQINASVALGPDLVPDSDAHRRLRAAAAAKLNERLAA